MSAYVVGDIHGRLEALEEVLEKSNFDRENDTLISLGDVCDGGKDTKKCFNILGTIKNKIITIGNHDRWYLNWIDTGKELPVWVMQGGYATMRSYGFNPNNVPDEHIRMLRDSIPYYIDSDNNIFVHGGFNPRVAIEKQTTEFITWDRTLVKYANEKKSIIKPYNRIFVGHTTTQFYKSEVPLFLGNVIMMDTSAGHKGKLTIMNVDTLEYWQSKTQQSCFEEDNFGMR